MLGLFLCLTLLTGCNSSTQEVSKRETVTVLKPEKVIVNQPSDIVILEDSLVVPRLYSNIIGLDSLPLDEKKMRFISALLPAILVAKERLTREKEGFRMLFKKETWDATDSLLYQQITQTYRTEDTTSILLGLEAHPNSIVLAQAAIESGWGNSRIFGEANNLFGIWSYSRKEPRIAASIKRDGQTIFLRKYADISESVHDYFVTIGRSKAYHNFRKARLQTQEVEALIPHLLYYSERREAYVDQLRTVIRFNGLKRFDHYQLDSSYYVNVSLPE